MNAKTKRQQRIGKQRQKRRKGNSIVMVPVLLDLTPEGEARLAELGGDMDALIAEDWPNGIGMPYDR